jgi:hypothetical protein
MDKRIRRLFDVVTPLVSPNDRLWAFFHAVVSGVAIARLGDDSEAGDIPAPLGAERPFSDFRSETYLALQILHRAA